MNSNRIFIVFLILIGAILLVLYVFFPQKLGTAFENIWLWIVGLIGTIGAGVKKLFSGLGGGGKIAEIEAENKRLQTSLNSINENIKKTNDQWLADKKQYDENIKALNDRLEGQQAAVKAEQGNREHVINSTDEDFTKGLSPKDREKIDDLDEGAR